MTIQTMGNRPYAAPKAVAERARPAGIFHTKMDKSTAAEVATNAALWPGLRITASMTNRMTSGMAATSAGAR